MNHSTRRLLVMLLTVLCFFNAPAGHAQDSRDVEQVRLAIASMERAWNKHDVDALASLFAEDADFVNVEGTRWRGRPAIKEAFAFVHKTIFKQSHWSVDDTTVRQLGPDVIVTRSTWRMDGQTTMKGEAVPARSGIITNVLVRSESTWLIAVTQNTDIVH